ncbi:hypothetical protein FA15DRAFT_702175 [Coprinopsis marcescibilis]|uniref:HIT-type domain-containing protein n=1 Tax=Coprinopsis marcescibilis TaxID=230819 RepID=A0A5C3L3G9_COPMA|nr:hypothetical protein FA15DRAFT_702175 [Coprinopsis marcescibilis]
MPPKRREQLARKAAVGSQVLDPEIIAKRTKRHLDELERSNYSEPTTLVSGQDEDDEEGGYSKGRARQTISDKRKVTIPGKSPAARSRKSTMNVRTALLYRKNFAALLDESNIATLPADEPTYLTAGAPPPTYPARLLCTVCGYFGSYKCRRCAMAYCNLNCESVHNETRCERRVL